MTFPTSNIQSSKMFTEYAFQQFMGGQINDPFINSIISYAFEASAEKNATGRVSCATKDKYLDGLVGFFEGKIANGVMGLMNSVFSLIGSTISEAIAETQANNAEANRIKEEQEETLEQATNDAKEITDNIDTQNQIIEEAQEALETIQKEQIEEQQQELENILAQIQANQDLLSNTTDPNEQKNLLATIQGLAGQILGIATALATAQTEIDTLTGTIQAAAIQIETLKGNSVKVVTDAENKIVQIQQEEVQQVAQNNQTNIEGEANLAQAAAMQTKAAGEGIGAIFTFGLSGISAVKDETEVAELIEAGNTRIESAATNLQSLATTVVGLDKIRNGIKTFNGVIENSLATYDSCIGAIGEQLPAMIESIGTISEACNVSKTLNSAVTDDCRALGINLDNDDNNNGQQTSQVSAATVETENTQSVKLKTPKVELPSFGI